MNETKPKLKLVRLQAENFKRLTAIDITLGDETIISGSNGAGKSSALDAIKVLLGGAKLAGEMPVRDGQSETTLIGTIKGESGEVYYAHRTLKAEGSPSIRITGEDGRAFNSPQALFDGFLGAAGAAAVDPIMFATATKNKRLELMRGLVKVDFADIDARKAELAEQRRDAERESTGLRAKWAAKPKHEGIPDAEVNVADLAAELESANAHNLSIQNLSATVDRMRATLSERESRIAALKAELVSLEAEHTTMLAALAQAVQDLNGKAPIPTDTITEKMRSVQEVNAKVRETQERKRDQARYAECEKVRVAANTDIASLEYERERRLRDAPFPIVGLGFGEDDVTYNGVPFSECSDGERIRVSTATMLAMAGQLSVITIHNASLLDKANRQIVRDLCREAGAQLILELVESDDPLAIVIEDGEVKK